MPQFGSPCTWCCGLTAHLHALCAQLPVYQPHLRRWATLWEGVLSCIMLATSSKPRALTGIPAAGSCTPMQHDRGCRADIADCSAGMCRAGFDMRRSVLLASPSGRQDMMTLFTRVRSLSWAQP